MLKSHKIMIPWFDDVYDRRNSSCIICRCLLIEEESGVFRNMNVAPQIVAVEVGSPLHRGLLHLITSRLAVPQSSTSRLLLRRISSLRSACLD